MEDYGCEDAEVQETLATTLVQELGRVRYCMADSGAANLPSPEKAFRVGVLETLGMRTRRSLVKKIIVVSVSFSSSCSSFPMAGSQRSK